MARSSDAKAISTTLETLQSTLSSGEGVAIKLTVCEVPDNEDLGSADALLTLRGRVKVCTRTCTRITTPTYAHSYHLYRLTYWWYRVT